MSKAREISKLVISQSNTVYFGVPFGNTATRPTPAIEGYIRYNTTLTKFEGFANGEWSSIGSGGGVYLKISANATLAKLTNYLVDTSNGAVYINLPSLPVEGDWVEVADGGGDKIILPAVIQRNGETINGSNTDIVIDVPNTRAQFIYTGSTWKVFVS